MRPRSSHAFHSRERLIQSYFESPIWKIHFACYRVEPRWHRVFRRDNTASRPTSTSQLRKILWNENLDVAAHCHVFTILYPLYTVHFSSIYPPRSSQSTPNDKTWCDPISRFHSVYQHVSLAEAISQFLRFFRYISAITLEAQSFPLLHNPILRHANLTLAVAYKWTIDGIIELRYSRRQNAFLTVKRSIMRGSSAFTWVSFHIANNAIAIFETRINTARSRRWYYHRGSRTIDVRLLTIKEALPSFVQRDTTGEQGGRSK